MWNLSASCELAKSEVKVLQNQVQEARMADELYKFWGRKLFHKKIAVNKDKKESNETSQQSSLQ